MNFKLLQLDTYGLPEDPKIQIPVYLIAAELQTRKLTNCVTIHGDNVHFIPDLTPLIVALIGFDTYSIDLMGYYNDLIERESEKVTPENSMPVKQALKIFMKLQSELGKL